MIDREKVIRGLECCIVGDGHSPKCEVCPYTTIGDDTCDSMDALLGDALALLKAQEARVMTLGEVREWVGKQRVDREPICVEVKDSICAWIVSDEYWDMQMDINLSSDLYGKTWRCWTSRPTAAEREATPWET